MKGKNKGEYEDIKKVINYKKKGRGKGEGLLVHKGKIGWREE